MHSWLEIFAVIADMQPGDMDKLDAGEASAVKKIANAIGKMETLCLDSEEYEMLNRVVDKLAPQSH